MASNTSSKKEEQSAAQSESEKSQKVLDAEARNEALRQELKSLESDMSTAAQKNEDRVRLTKLESEQKRLEAEIAYQKRLKDARVGARTEQKESAPEPPPTPENKDKGAEAPANGKDK